MDDICVGVTGFIYCAVELYFRYYCDDDDDDGDAHILMRSRIVFDTYPHFSMFHVVSSVHTSQICFSLFHALYMYVFPHSFYMIFSFGPRSHSRVISLLSFGVCNLADIV